MIAAGLRGGQLAIGIHLESGQVQVQVCFLLAQTFYKYGAHNIHGILQRLEPPSDKQLSVQFQDLLKKK